MVKSLKCCWGKWKVAVNGELDYVRGWEGSVWLRCQFSPNSCGEMDPLTLGPTQKWTGVRTVKTTFGRLTLPDFQSCHKAIVSQDSVKILASKSPGSPVNQRRMSRTKLTLIGQLIFDKEAKAAQPFWTVRYSWNWISISRKQLPSVPHAMYAD